MSERSQAVSKSLARSRRTHAKARTASKGRPRMVIFRSNRAIYAQVCDDATGKILFSASNLKGKSGCEGAAEVGKVVAELAQKNKVSAVAFDRNGYRYHGQVKALAEAAREGGLQF